ncbi:acyl carrier protein [Tindallia californiensis]|uniref:Acyl carrier protein n=1 Tax=Tindallia californiensis TaxID=159292 RepID=A0A1H3MRL1_9FIRM|nr:acyl carrier protein [Tindallia californiensis]SDY79307.1 acyl carrier protein [Tindallia californiensis]
MVFEKIAEIIAEQLELDGVEGIKAETSIMDDLEADSLDAVEIVMAIEDAFSIEISDEDAEGFKNIGDIVKYVESKQG